MTRKRHCKAFQMYHRFYLKLKLARLEGMIIVKLLGSEKSGLGDINYKVLGFLNNYNENKQLCLLECYIDKHLNSNLTIEKKRLKIPTKRGFMLTNKALKAY